MSAANPKKEVSDTKAIDQRLRAAPPGKRISYCDSFMGNPLNQNIPHDSGFFSVIAASRMWRGLSTFLQAKFAKVKKHGGIGETWIGFNRTFVLTNPAAIQQVIMNMPKIVDGEVGGIQKRFLGARTPVALPSRDPQYPSLRRAIQHSTNPEVTHELTDLFKESMQFSFREMAEKKDIDLVDFTTRLSMRVISSSILGIMQFSEDKERNESLKSELANIVCTIAAAAPNPALVVKLELEEKIASLGVKKPNLVGNLDRLVKRGEAIIKDAIRLNPVHVLTKLKAFTGNKDLTVADLTEQVVLDLIKFLMIAGSETTSKLLLFCILILGLPQYQPLAREIRQEMIDKGITLDNLEHVRLHSLRTVQNFILEVLRKYPAFSYMRYSVKEDFHISKDMLPCSTKAEYRKKSIGEDELISIPKGSLVFASIIDAHHDEKLFESPHEFKPDRWNAIDFDFRRLPDQLKLMTFGNDNRYCVGAPTAIEEAGIMLVQILSQYDVRHNLPADLPIEPGFMLELKKGVKAIGNFMPISMPAPIVDSIPTPGFRLNQS